MAFRDEDGSAAMEALGFVYVTVAKSNWAKHRLKFKKLKRGDKELSPVQII